jgi:photosystem II stability/assembly factor-like uncharacterized protein
MTATQVPLPPITGLLMLNANAGWAWTDTGQLLRTSDGGMTWIDRSAGPRSDPADGFYLNSQTAWQPIFIQKSNRIGLLQTTDGGQNWTQISYSPQNSLGQVGALHFTDNLNGWAETWDGGAGRWDHSLFITRDGGKTWTLILAKDPRSNASLPTGTITLGSIDSYYYDPKRIIIVYGNEASFDSSLVLRMQVSFDSGNTWQSQSLPLPKNESETLMSADSPTFFGSGNGLLAVELVKLDNNGNTIFHRLAFYATKDGGANWSLLPGVLDNVAMSPQTQVISPNDIFALCISALCASHDGAQTWQQVAANLDFSQSDTRSVYALDFVDARTGWVLIKQNENSLLYRTTDGGVTWNQITSLLAASSPVIVDLDTGIATPTP